MDYMRYRDFVAYLRKESAENPEERVASNRYTAETAQMFLSFVPGKDGGVALVKGRNRHGMPPKDSGTTYPLDPGTLMSGLADYMLRPEMMQAGRAMLTPGEIDPIDVMQFALGMHALPVLPFAEEDVGAREIGKPPSLSMSLWMQIPTSKRREWFRAMAMGLRRGIHPDHTVEALLGLRESIQ